MTEPGRFVITPMYQVRRKVTVEMLKITLPSANGPGNRAQRPGGSPNGMPCWITEWGFKNHDTSCPAHEAESTFRGYADQGRLAGLFYYAWIDTRENFGVNCCGALTESGRLEPHIS